MRPQTPPKGADRRRPPEAVVAAHKGCRYTWYAGGGRGDAGTVLLGFGAMLEGDRILPFAVPHAIVGRIGLLQRIQDRIGCSLIPRVLRRGLELVSELGQRHPLGMSVDEHDIPAAAVAHLDR